MTARVWRASWPRAALCCAAAVLACASAVTALTPVGAGAATRAPIPSAMATTTDSWAVLPMGQLNDPSNTFWQLLHAVPGSSHWSVVTPPGAADNGGLVAGVGPGGALVGVLPSKLLRFSPLSDSHDGGQTWSAGVLPGALAARPDALAYQPGSPGRALAIVGTAVLHASADLSSWAPLASLDQLRVASRGCDPSALDAVAFAQSGDPLVAVGCRHGGTAVLTDAAGTWRSVALAPRPFGGAEGATVLRLETAGSTTVALESFVARGRLTLNALTEASDGTGSTSASLRLPAGASVQGTAIGADGVTSVLASSTDARFAFAVSPGGQWVRLPAPPARAVALASTGLAAPSFGSLDVDLFAVSGTELRVFALTPPGTKWVNVQTTQVSLAYGSSG